MTTWQGMGDYHDLAEWQLADGVSTLIKETCDALDIKGDREWVVNLISQAADEMPAAIAEARDADFLSEYILGVDGAITHATVAGYCFHFLRGEGLIEAETADYVESRLAELESSLLSLTRMLRESLPQQRRFSNN